MWTVPFQEYVKFDGVKESIKQVKVRKKEQMKNISGAVHGYSVETGISNIIGSIPGVDVKVLPPQMDMGFGADIQISYMEEDKNYSLFADITTNPNKDRVSYLTQSGGMTGDIKDALCYKTEYFNIRFGLKEKHMNWFFYEKPVVVVHVEHYIPTTGIAVHHIHVIGNMIKSLNSLLVKRGYGARASQRVRPNPKRFPDEYKKIRTIN